MSLQEVFLYFSPKQLIPIQALHKKYYYRVIPALIRKVSLFEMGNVKAGYYAMAKDAVIKELDPLTLEWEDAFKNRDNTRSIKGNRSGKIV